MITATFGIEKEISADLLREAEHGKAQLPDFQRGWVWDDAHVKALLGPQVTGKRIDPGLPGEPEDEPADYEVVDGYDDLEGDAA